MTDAVVVLAFVALVLALVAELLARGRSLEGWAAVALSLAILVSHGVFPLR